MKVIVTVNDEKEIREYKVDELKFKARRKKEKMKLSAEELKALEVLEKEERKEERVSKLDNN